MNKVIFDIKKFSHVTGENIDVSFIPMMQRRKLNKFGRAALFTLYGAYEGGSPNLVFASNYGDVERVEKLIEQRKEDGEVSPAGFGSSVHNAVIGLFSLLEKINTSYNSISAGENSISAGFLESILSEESLFCYAESLGGIKSVSVLTSQNPKGDYVLSGKDYNTSPLAADLRTDGAKRNPDSEWIAPIGAKLLRRNSTSVEQIQDGEVDMLNEACELSRADEGFVKFIDFLEGRADEFVSDLYVIKRRAL